MTKLLYPDFFNDVFGPIMQPGSSSNFAGMSRVGRAARYTLSSLPRHVRILFNPGDQQLLTLGNMMEDRGYLGGLQDFATDDIRLFNAHELARASKISYEFDELLEDNPYPGSVTFELEGIEGDISRFVGQSIGGGMITSYEINGYPVRWQADSHALFVWNASPAQCISADAVFSKREDYLGFTSAGNASGKKAMLYEFSEPIEAALANSLFPAPAEWRMLPALLPVISTKHRKPQLFQTVAEWRQVAQERNISFVQAAIEYEKAFSGWKDEKIWAFFEKISQILDRQIHALEELGYDNVADTPNLPIYGKLWRRYLDEDKSLQDPIAQHILVHAFSTNAKIPGVRIVPGPMGTGGGYLYSALDAVREARGFSHQRLVEGLVVAAALGALAYTHTNASGAAGCVGESGVCCAMASGAITWMAGGDGYQVEHAASMALQANLGIPCDPIPGGKEFPCITRTLRAAITAPLYADLALCGMDPLIPYHEVLQAIEHNRQNTPANRLCGALCGINCVPSAIRCREVLQSDLMNGKLRYEAE